LNKAKLIVSLKQVCTNKVYTIQKDTNTDYERFTRNINRDL